MHTVLLWFRPLPNIGIQNVDMWGMYDLVKAYRSIQNPLPNRRVKDWEASNGHTKDTTWLFHSQLHDAHGGTHLCAVIKDVEQTPFSSIFAGLPKVMQINKALKWS